MTSAASKVGNDAPESLLPGVTGELPFDRLPGANDPLTAVRRSAEAFEASNAETFDLLYAGYSRLLRGVAMRKFGVSREDSDDLVQDVFATFLANPAGVRDLHAYLIGAICNAARQHRRRGEAAPFCEEMPVSCAAAASDDVAESVIQSLVIDATLARLGASCRDTLQRFYIEGESALSIASARDTTANYIFRLLNYCRNRARAIYEELRLRT